MTRASPDLSGRPVVRVPQPGADVHPAATPGAGSGSLVARRTSDAGVRADMRCFFGPGRGLMEPPDRKYDLGRVLADALAPTPPESALNPGT
jgi:hypothetical protein